jgi:hypothetical protein
MMTERPRPHIPPYPVVRLYRGQVPALRCVVCMEGLESVAREGGGRQTSSLAMVEESKEEEDNSEDDNYVDVVGPGPITAVIDTVRCAGTSRCGSG